MGRFCSVLDLLWPRAIETGVVDVEHDNDEELDEDVDVLDFDACLEGPLTADRS